MKKTIKAWAVIRKEEIKDAKVEMDDGCGFPTTDALGIYPTEYDATMAMNHDKRFKESVVSCTITFSV